MYHEMDVLPKYHLKSNRVCKAQLSPEADLKGGQIGFYNVLLLKFSANR